MARKKPDPENAGPDWYLRDWMQQAGISQAELARRTGWSAPTVNDIYNGKTAYYREIVNAIAAALDIQPFELLMPPSSAVAYADLRKTAVHIVHGAGRAFNPEPAAPGQSQR